MHPPLFYLFPMCAENGSFVCNSAHNPDIYCTQPTACFEYVGEDSHQDSDMCFHDTYCRKTDTPKQYIQAWTPIVAASQSVKAIEDEREFLKKWVNVVDYV